MASPLDYLARLPVDLLTDSLLPAVAPRDLVSLARTCRAWRDFLAGEGGPCEIVWQRKAERDFRFPVRASGRRTGWLALYRSLAVSSACVWGQTSNGRLGLPSNRYALPAPLRNLVIGDALPIPTRIELPAPPVSLVAGGWSFHALTAEGNVVSWGQLNGGLFTGGDAPLSNEGRILRPTVLPQMGTLGPVAQLEAGRGHAVMLGEDGRVWEMRAFGRVAEVRDEARCWGAGTQNEVAAVQAGWDYSAVLTASGDIFVWWGLPPAACDEGATAAGEAGLSDPSSEGVAFPLDLDTLKLPPLPPSPADDPISLISCGDDFVIALTKAGQLFYLDLSPVPAGPGQRLVPPGANNDPHDSRIRSRESRGRLETAFLTGSRAWVYLRRFCEMNEVARLDGFRETGITSGTRITHISAHFDSFAAYSVPSTSDPAGSIVLLGRKGVNEESEPQVIPELQSIGVIKVAHGDYHNLALTSSGHLYSWGAYSAGALGLGHPQLPNTPLSSAAANATPPAPEAQQPRPYSMPQISNPTAQLPTPQPQAPYPLFPGFAPARPAALVERPPERVEKPTRVRFAGELDGARETGRERFVYAVTAAGWHSGCLAVDASSSSTAGAAVEEEPVIRLSRPPTAEEEMAHLARAADEESLNGARSWMGRLGAMGPFRVGFAGRGAARGGGGALTRGTGRGG
ncbi:hypothetical protein JCM10449v2_003672 [Rhodotorula kratochvilovae]